MIWRINDNQGEHEELRGTHVSVRNTRMYSTASKKDLLVHECKKTTPRMPWGTAHCPQFRNASQT
eukprot:4072437-Prorocentrum_lima.AAC.1